MPPHGHEDHDHSEHGHAHEEDRRIRVLHGASPFCHWSYAYEPVLQRLRLVYGDQIAVNVYEVPVYRSWQQWMTDYELDDAGLKAWLNEMDGLIGLPVNRAILAKPTADCLPGTLVAHAAELAKPGSAEKVARRISFHLYLEGKNYDSQDELLKVAEACGVPRKAVEQHLADGSAEARLNQDGGDMHALGLNFYALQVADSEGRTVVLEHAFEPAKVEEAVEWLSRGKLKKRALPTVPDYLASHAPVSLFEVQRVFRLEEAEALKAAQPAEKAGRVVRTTLNGHPCWLPKR